MATLTIPYQQIMNYDDAENNCVFRRRARNFHRLCSAGLTVADGLILTPDFFSRLFSSLVDEKGCLHSPDLCPGLGASLEDLLEPQLTKIEALAYTTENRLLSLSISFNAQTDLGAELSEKTFYFNGLKELSSILLEEVSDFLRCHDESVSVSKISACIQSAASSADQICGVANTRDEDSGFEGVAIVRASYGLLPDDKTQLYAFDEFHISKIALAAGKKSIVQRNLGHKSESTVMVQQQINRMPCDEASRLSFSITDDEVVSIASIAIQCEQILAAAVEISWYKSGGNQHIVLINISLMARENPTNNLLERYLLKDSGQVLIEGRSVGQRIATGPVRIITNRKDIGLLREGEILVTDMTDPDWESVIDKAAAIITNRGGRTCHAAIIARELGVPAIVGCINATEVLKGIDHVTVSCAEGDMGYIYKGKLDYAVSDQTLFHTPDIDVEILMNVGNPDRAYSFQAHPNNGVGLARLEFIINRMIGIHPKALLNSHKLSAETQAAINIRMAGFDNAIEFYKCKLMEGVATIAAAFYPKKVVVRLSDFKSNEYGHLIGGNYYEPAEENPMLGFRGVSRYLSDDFKPCFELECQALKAVRDEMGFTNVELMVPFCRTLGEARQVIELLEENGLVRGERGLKIIMMCEIPAHALLADQFLPYFDGFSIGSNDLPQLTLGLDRDSALVAHLFDERNDAVKMLFKMAIDACKAQGKTISVCGQAPSEHPELASWFVEQGVDGLSLNPDSVLEILMHLNAKKRQIAP